MKGRVATNQQHLAHPPITNDRLLKFLDRLGSGDTGLEAASSGDDQLLTVGLKL